MAGAPGSCGHDGVSHGSFAVPAQDANLFNQMFAWGGHGEASPPRAEEKVMKDLLPNGLGLELGDGTIAFALRRIPCGLFAAVMSVRTSVCGALISPGPAAQPVLENGAVLEPLFWETLSGVPWSTPHPFSAHRPPPSLPPTSHTY